MELIRDRKNYHSWPELSKTQLSVFKGSRATSGDEGAWDRNKAEFYEQVIQGRSRVLDSDSVSVGTIVHECLLMDRELISFCVAYPRCCYTGDTERLNSRKAKQFKRFALMPKEQRQKAFVAIPPEFVIKSGDGISTKPVASRWKQEKQFACPEVEFITKEELLGFNTAMYSCDCIDAIPEFVLTQEQIKNCANCVTTLKQSEFGKWINASHREEPIVWSENVYLDGSPYEFNFRCCPDFCVVLNDAVLAFDLKVTVADKPSAFARHVKKYSYWLQDAHYTKGLQSKYPEKRIEYRFLTINPENLKYGLFALNEYSREVAQEERNVLLNDLARCYVENDWTNKWTVQEHELVLSHYDF